MNQQTIENMKRYGGSFVSRLAELWQVADAQNQRKLEDAFGDVFDRHEGAAPVKAPSDEIIEAVEAYGRAYSMPNTTASELSIRLHEIRALLARYGHPVEPEGWQAAPKFGEEK